MNQFQKSTRRILRRILCTLTAAAACTGILGEKAYAECVTQEHAEPGVLYETVFHSKTTGSAGEHSTYSPDGEYLAVLGMPAYCIEPQMDLTVGEDTYASSTLSEYVRYPEDLKRRIAEIAHFGFMYGGRNNPLWWQVTQVMIWEAISPGYLDATFCRNGQDVTAEAMEYVRQIENDIHAYETAPVLTACDSAGNVLASGLPLTAEAPVGETVRVADSAGVLNSYNIVSDGLQPQIENNAFSIAVTADMINNPQEIKLVHQASDPAVNPAALVFVSTDWQTVATGLGVIDVKPMEAQIEIRARPLSLSVKKADPAGHAVAGAVLQILDGSTVLYEGTTDQNGFRISEAGKLQPGKTYTLREKTVPDGYVQAADRTFTMTAADTEVTMTDGQVFAAKVSTDPESGEKKTVIGAALQAEDEKGNVLDRWTSGKQPHAISHLKEGKTYILRETKVPEGYVLAEPVRFTADAGEVHIEMEDGQVYAVKYSDVSADASGKAAKTPLTGAAMQVIEHGSNKVIDSWTSTGKAHIISGLQEGKKYILHEKQAPPGYLPAEDIVFTAGKNSQLLEMTDIAVRARLAIRKEIAESDESGFLGPEKGAEFTVIHDDLIRRYGSFEKAASALKQLRPDMSARIVTDEKGYAETGDLVYGTYTVRQTKSGSGELEMLKEPFAFIVDGSSPEVTVFSVANRMRDYDIRIEKKDAKTGRLITASPAVFEILDEDGKPVKQKVGSHTFTRFAVNAQAAGKLSGVYVNSSDEPGTLTLPLPLKAGRYTVREVSAPEGYTAARPYAFEVSSVAVLNEDTDVRVQIVNQRRTGSLHVHKSIPETEADATLINRSDLSSVVYELRAVSDICDPCDGQLITPAGGVFGTYSPDAEGNVQISEIPLGVYEWKEVSAPAGMLVDPEAYPVVLDETKPDQELNVRLDLTDQTTVASITKKTVTGQDELPGAHLRISDLQDTTVKDIHGKDLDWISSDRPYVIEGLTAGQEYILTETIAPKGFVRSSSVRFKVHEDGTVTEVKMINRTVSVSKQDCGAAELPGAQMSVTDEQGNIIDSWISSDQPHYAEGLAEGGSYVLHENTAPLGYVKATDIPFTISDGGPDVSIAVTDAVVQVEKEDHTGRKVIGALLQVKDTEGNVIDEWLSEQEPHPVSGLTQGQTYVLHEEYTPAGWYPAEDITFTAAENGQDQVICMKDRVIDYRIRKLYAGSDRAVEGAQLKLTDLTNNMPAGEWTTGEEECRLCAGVSGILLEAGHTYQLEESAWIDGVHKARDIIFTVDGRDPGNRPVIILMEDIETGIRVRKTRPDGSCLPGASMELRDMDGNVLHAWQSSGESEDISAFVQGGRQYVIHENSAPFGYLLSEDTVFTAEGTKDHVQQIEVRDLPCRFRLQIIKKDEDDGTLLKDAHFAVCMADGETPAEDAEGKAAEAVTGENGGAELILLYTEDGYVLKETKAPAGYLISEKTMKITVPEGYAFTKDNVLSLTVTDRKIPGVPTGIGLPAASAAVLAGSLAGLIFLFIRTGKKKR